MLASSITCPECHTVLRSTNPIPAGKKVKCPKCASFFTAGAEQEEEGGSYAFEEVEPAAPSAARKKMAKELEQGDDEEPASKNGRTKPRKRAREEEEDEEELDDEEEVRPRVKARPKLNRGKKKKSGAGLVLALIFGGSFLFLLACGAVGVYLFLNWDKNRGSGDEDLLAYVPADSEVIIGLDFNTLLGRSELGPIRDVIKDGDSDKTLEEIRKQTGLEYKDLFGRVVLGIKQPNRNAFRRFDMGFQNPTYTWVSRSTMPFSQSRIRKSTREPLRKTAQGKSYFQINETPFTRLFMPSDRTMVLSTVSDTQMENLIGTGGSKPLLSANTIGILRTLQQDPVWLVVPMDSMAQEGFFIPDDGPAEAQGLAEAAKKLTAISFRAKMESSQAKVTLGLHFRDREAASGAAEAIQAIWDQRVKPLGGVGLGMVPVDIRQLLEELIQNAQISSQATMAQITCDLSLQSIGRALQEVVRQQRRAAQQVGE